MKDTILLISRYKEIHKLERIGQSDSCLFLFTPADEYYRLGYSDNKEDTYDFVDPSGGPFIHVGMTLGDLNIIVKSITKNKNGDIIIELNEQ